MHQRNPRPIRRRRPGGRLSSVSQFSFDHTGSIALNRLATMYVSIASGIHTQGHGRMTCIQGHVKHNKRLNRITRHLRIKHRGVLMIRITTNVLYNGLRLTRGVRHHHWRGTQHEHVSILDNHRGPTHHLYSGPNSLTLTARNLTHGQLSKQEEGTPLEQVQDDRGALP